MSSSLIALDLHMCSDSIMSVGKWLAGYARNPNNCSANTRVSGLGKFCVRFFNASSGQRLDSDGPFEHSLGQLWWKLPC